MKRVNWGSFWPFWAVTLMIILGGGVIVPPDCSLQTPQITVALHSVASKFFFGGEGQQGNFLEAEMSKMRVKHTKNCHFYPEIVKLWLILKLFLGQTGGKKIFLGGNAPMPTCGTTTVCIYNALNMRM